jgi:diguanylate cyclase (GGDEF)-like protein
MNANIIKSKKSETLASAPLSSFYTKSDLFWTLNDKKIWLGSLTLYSSSEVVFERVWFGFSLIAIAAIIKLSVLFGLFIWAFGRYLGSPLKELMSQVDEVQLSHDISKRIDLSYIEKNELSQLQENINNMLSTMETDRSRLLEDEQAKRNWLENAVALRTQELQISNEKLKELATKDSLTGAFNHASFFDTAQHLLALTQRQKTQASFVLMDLDHFKTINDSYGHFIGDQVIVHCIHTIQASIRKSDLVGRVGGEEFALFLPGTGLNEAFRVADKIRDIIAKSKLDIDGKIVSYTVSIGVASSEPTDPSISEIFKRADLKLYKAKNKGRNRVEK